jgi:asparagine synthase (glutamine-hydrolysing)
MAAQAGVFFFDMRSARGRTEALTSGLRHLAPDGVSIVEGDGVALGHGGFHVWSGERTLKQPLRSVSGVVATWDGRLDNRDDLQLQLGGPLERDAGDGEIALAAFERWGSDGLRRLVGEWSVVIWNPVERTLHLARDYMGVRPLYYCAADASVMWSTGLGELAVRSGRADTLSEAFVAGFMTLQFSPALTPYEGIHAVPAATCVSFSAAGGRIEYRRQFWQLAPAVLRYRDDRHYEEHLRALWTDAIRTRLRVDGTVWAELSGGLDSSSVVCMASALLESGEAAAHGIRTASHATLLSPEGDERRYIAEVERLTGVQSEIFGVEDHQALVDDEWGWVTPVAARGVGLACVRRIQQSGGRIVLSGRAGDAVMGCLPDNSIAVCDDIAAGHLLTALRNLRLWSRACCKPFVELAWHVVRSHFTRSALELDTGGIFGARLGGADLLEPRLRSMAEDLDARRRRLESSMVADLPISKRPLATVLAAYSLDCRLTVPNQPPRITFSYPFVHRPLVEFMMAVPGAQLSAPGDLRSLMRRSFAGFVPSPILQRSSKGYYPPASARAVRIAVTAMPPVARLEVVRRGWVDSTALERAIRRLVDGGGHGGAEVRRVLHLEQWLELRHRRAPAVIPRGKEVNRHALLHT